MDAEDFGLSTDLSQIPLSGGRPVCLGSDFPASEVLLEDPGLGGLGGRRLLLSVVDSPAVRISPVQLTSKGLTEGCSRGDRSPPGCTSVATETVVSPTIVSVSRNPKKSTQDSGSTPSTDFPLSSCRRKPSHLTVWPISGNVVTRQAFLKELPIWRPVPFGPQPGLLTIPGWLDSSTGVLSPRQILVQPL